ncbi:d8177bca-350c-4a76-b0d7-95195772106f [Sclerotinia trifoliorum]|uniref:D8177bca-350c-4a76-b0d7-95195772106f n=1 Tax=Sclerotinia trifoliorum TaxID=28548 RepID=A0A8H2ZNV4_9HELO|nr:d8177bca-350c-4a76-b0d7-95195772106f [Sclerotinia trifoliorum]
MYSSATTNGLINCCRVHGVGKMGSIKSASMKENGEKRGWKRSKSKSSSWGIHKGNKGPRKYIVEVSDSKEEVVREELFEGLSGPWSDWFWSEDYQVFYRGRLDANDMWDYEYDYQVPKRETPRFVPPINIESVESEKVALEVSMELPDIGAEEYTWMMGFSEDMKIGVMDEEEVQDVETMKGKDGNESFEDQNSSENNTQINIEDAGKKANKKSMVTKDYERKQYGYGGRKR